MCIYSAGRAALLLCADNVVHYNITLHYITADTVCTDLDNISPAIVSAIIRVEDLMSRMRDGITTRFKLSQYFIPLRCEHHFELENWGIKMFFILSSHLL